MRILNSYSLFNSKKTFIIYNYYFFISNNSRQTQICIKNRYVNKSHPPQKKLNKWPLSKKDTYLNVTS